MRRSIYLSIYLSRHSRILLRRVRHATEGADLIAELGAPPADTHIPPQCYVFIYAGLRERERALEYQKRAYEDGASSFNYLTPFIRGLYALSPHHKKRLEQMRLIV